MIVETNKKAATKMIAAFTFYLIKRDYSFDQSILVMRT